MRFSDRAWVECRRVATLILRALAITAVVCLAIPLVLLSWLFWIGVYCLGAIMIIASGPRTLFRYEEKCDECSTHPEPPASEAAPEACKPTASRRV